MARLVSWFTGHSSKRAQHLVFLGHVWLLVPFLILWLRDRRIAEELGAETVVALRPIVAALLLYLIARTWLAWRDPPWLKWELVFPPIDVALITLILCLSHRGPMSNLSMLYLLPIVSAAGSLNVGWSAAVGLMVVGGTALSAYFSLGFDFDSRVAAMNLRDLWDAHALNIAFRLYFLVLISSLISYQALIAAGMKERLAVAADRNRIAADMHDGVQGHLMTISAQLELLSKVAERDPCRAAELALEARDTARQGADELRFLVQRMRAPALAEGFVPALRQYAHHFCSRHELELTFQVHGLPEPLEPNEEGTLFRVAQEALTNVVKHARASSVRMDLHFEEGEVRLTIRDDGIGFVPAEADPSEGLAGMCARLEKLGGKLEVKSAPGEGATITATV